MREHWLLDPGIVFLNHGSFGATPRQVLAVQDGYRARLEQEPVRFLVRELEPLLDAARARVAGFVGADAAGLAFVPNATAGVNAVLRSLALAEGDELIVTTHEYNASRNALDAVAARAGARIALVEIPFPITSPGEVVDRVMARLTARTRLLLIDHVTSPTALVLPVGELVSAVAARGIDTLVDGAHAPGMLPLDLARLGAAYYTGNLHKWVCAPKGCAFLHVREDRREAIRPLAVSHGANSPRADRSRYHLEFDWTGTFDPSAWLSVPAAIDFMGALLPGGWPALMDRNRALARRGRDILAAALGVAAPAPDTMLGSMAALPLPDGTQATAASLFGDPLQDALLERHHIEVPVVAWPRPPRRLVRVSAQAYNGEGDYERLAAALREELRTPR